MTAPQMNSMTALLYFGAAVVALVTLLLSLVRVLRGPTPVERILAAQLMGTTGVGVLLPAETGFRRAGYVIPGLMDVALVFAVLAAVTGIAFVYRGWEHASGEKVNHGLDA